MNGVAPRVAVVALAAAGAFAGCGGGESSCADTRTCSSSAGSDGSDRIDAMGGAAGADLDAGSDSDPVPKCTSAGDCDDGLACNGVEHCVEGDCVAGTPVVCNNPDPTHCAVGTCVESDGGADCPVTALDEDGDGHGDEHCVANPGDDCDDMTQAVHPGAAEVCNGIDDDCNGKTDTDDGMPLGGSNAALVGGTRNVNQMDAAWSPTSSVYGVVWTDNSTGQEQTYYEAMSTAGAPIGNPVPLYSTSKWQYSPQIAWGSTRFGVAWRDESNDAIMFQTVATDGSSPNNPVIVGAGGTRPGIVWSEPEQQFVVFWISSAHDSRATGIHTDGTLGATINFGIAADSHVEAAGAGVLGGLFELSSTAKTSSGLNFGLFSGVPKVQSNGSITTFPTPDGEFNSPVALAGADNGFAMIWHSYTSLLDSTDTYQERALDRSVICGPITLDDATFAGSLAAYPGGRAAVIESVDNVTQASALTLQRITPGCVLAPSRPAIRPLGSELVGNPKIVYAGASGFAVFWLQEVDKTNFRWELWRRTFGPLFCN